MKIKVKVHPNSSKEDIRETNEFIEVWLREKPVDSRANFKLLELLKDYFKKPVRIKSGLTSRIKIVEVIE